MRPTPGSRRETAAGKLERLPLAWRAPLRHALERIEPRLRASLLAHMALASARWADLLGAAQENGAKQTVPASRGPASALPPAVHRRATARRSAVGVAAWIPAPWWRSEDESARNPGWRLRRVILGIHDLVVPIRLARFRIAVRPITGRLLWGEPGYFHRFAEQIAQLGCRHPAGPHRDCPLAELFGAGLEMASGSGRNLAMAVPSRRAHRPGAVACFHLSLSGPALAHLPLLIAALSQWGPRDPEAPFDLIAVSTFEGDEPRLFFPEPAAVQPMPLPVTGRDLVRVWLGRSQRGRTMRPVYGKESLTLELIDGPGEVPALREPPPFHQIVEAAFNRLEDMVDPVDRSRQAAATRRDAVRLAAQVERSAQSRRGASVWATYRGPWQPFLPLLRLAEFMNLGPGAWCGQGAIRLPAALSLLPENRSGSAHKKWRGVSSEIGAEAGAP